MYRHARQPTVFFKSLTYPGAVLTCIPTPPPQTPAHSSPLKYRTDYQTSDIQEQYWPDPEAFRPERFLKVRLFGILVASIIS